MTKLEQLQIKTQDSINFLRQHPAICADITGLFSTIDFSISKVCKRGYINPFKQGLQITYHSKLAKLFKEDFKKELEKLKKEIEEEKATYKIKKPFSFEAQKHFLTIWKTYKQVYNEPWKFDHIEFWADICFYVYNGKATDTKEAIATKEEMNIQNWHRYHGFTVSSRTFEEMIIKIATKFKKIFGNFTCEDFLTKKEIANHKKHRIFNFVKKGNGLKLTTMKSNPQYIHISDSELNKRWVKWFSKTPYAIKNWKGEFKC